MVVVAVAVGVAFFRKAKEVNPTCTETCAETPPALLGEVSGWVGVAFFRKAKEGNPTCTETSPGLLGMALVRVGVAFSLQGDRRQRNRNRNRNPGCGCGCGCGWTSPSSFFVLAAGCLLAAGWLIG